MQLRCCFAAVLLVCCLVDVKGSDLAFTTSTTTLQSPITRNLTLRCSLTDSVTPGHSIVGRDLTHTAIDVMYVTSMVVSKDGADFASISEHVPAHAFGTNSSFQVTGRISSNEAVKGSIELQWLYPKSDAAGTYKCEVFGVDKQGHGFSYSKSLVIEENVTDLASQVASMKQLMDLMRNQISQLQSVQYNGAPCDASHKCAGDLQCQSLSETCSCPMNHYLVDADICAPGLGATCNTTDQCTGWDVHCTNNQCSCPSGFFPGLNTCLRVLDDYSYKYLAFSSPAIVATPNWPFNAPHTDIDYVIYADNGNHVRFTFTHLNLSTKYMAIYVFDDSDANDSKQLARITYQDSSSSWAGRVFTSSSNVLFIRYRSQRSSDIGYFRATFNRDV